MESILDSNLIRKIFLQLSPYLASLLKKYSIFWPQHVYYIKIFSIYQQIYNS